MPVGPPGGAARHQGCVLLICRQERDREILRSADSAQNDGFSKEGRCLRTHGDGVARGVQQLAGVLADIPVAKHGIARDQQLRPGSHDTADGV